MSPRARSSLFSVVWFTLISWVPASLLLLLPNDWYWIVAKVVLGFVLMGAIANLLPPRSLPHMGTAGPGFVLNLALLCALMYFSMPTWMQVIGVLLIAHTLYVCYTIIRKHLDADPMLNQIRDSMQRGRDAGT